ncbi:hypothetical protein GDO78_019840 [Eleutherodactylus coqui]|uniref:Olfactory receptor n=1 Tax=Eleutherodactylus coqui TaxID=57060 RepID=A0A8J6EIJ2_ELECQ|nr:hypothetical protein GDO78_019840 [Eleutherodactylus coqui]
MIILTITLESQLHSPMYLFLCVLSITELFYISSTVPRMLRDFLHVDKTISFAGCAAQLYFFSFLGAVECFILAFMAYDRYVAICHPLHYMTIMTKAKCTQFSIASWLGGMTLPMTNIVLVFQLPYCDSNIVDHFFCDILPVMKLACARSFGLEMSIAVYSFLVLPFPFLLIIVSYIRILIAVFQIHSAAGRSKRAKALSLLYLVFVPMLNPLIYSMRNVEVKKAMKRVFKRLVHTQN